ERGRSAPRRRGRRTGESCGNEPNAERRSGIKSFVQSNPTISRRTPAPASAARQGGDLHFGQTKPTEERAMISVRAIHRTLHALYHRRGGHGVPREHLSGRPLCLAPLPTLRSLRGRAPSAIDASTAFWRNKPNRRKCRDCNEAYGGACT